MDNLDEFESGKSSTLPASYVENDSYEDKTEVSVSDEIKEESENAEKKSIEDDDFKNILTKSGKPKTKLFSVISLILGAASVIISFFAVWGIFVAVAALCISLYARKSLGYFDPRSIAGLSLGTVGGVIPIALVILDPIIKALYS